MNTLEKLRKVQEALEFYKADFTYRRQKWSLKNCNKSWKNPDISRDKGKSAQKALALLPEIIAEVEKYGWQPIETAPRDGGKA